MRLREFIAMFLVPAISASMLNDANARVVIDELAPATDLYSRAEAPDPYQIALRNLLVGEYRQRKCQIVAIPSFEKEWAVYIIRNNGESSIILRVLKKHLWAEMMREISDNGTKKSYSLSAKSQSAALSKLSKQVEKYSTPISEETADVMETAWEMLLARVKYNDNAGLGYDGTTYHVSHWKRGEGYRSGITWSPEKGTLPADLISIGESMKEIVGFSGKGRKLKEKEIKDKAKLLIRKIKER